MPSENLWELQEDVLAAYMSYDERYKELRNLLLKQKEELTAAQNKYVDVNNEITFRTTKLIHELEKSVPIFQIMVYPSNAAESIPSDSAIHNIHYYEARANGLTVKQKDSKGEEYHTPVWFYGKVLHTVEVDDKGKVENTTDFYSDPKFHAGPGVSKSIRGCTFYTPAMQEVSFKSLAKKFLAEIGAFLKSSHM